MKDERFDMLFGQNWVEQWKANIRSPIAFTRYRGRSLVYAIDTALVDNFTWDHSPQGFDAWQHRQHTMKYIASHEALFKLTNFINNLNF